MACKSGAEPGVAGQGGDSCDRKTEAIVTAVSPSATLGFFQGVEKELTTGC